jgi:hypothetical protein
VSPLASEQHSDGVQRDGSIERDDAVGGGDLAALLSPPARWGYEYVEPPPLTPSPEREHPPVRKQVRLIPRTRAEGLWEATALVAVGAVFAIVLDASFGLFSGGAHGTFATIGVLAVHTISAAIAFRAAQAWFRSAPDGILARAVGGAGRRWGAPVLNAGITFLAPYLVLPSEAIRGWRRIARERGDSVPHPGEAQRAEADYATATAAWQERIAQFEAAERRRLQGSPVWYPIPFSRDTRVTCLFGGSPLAWTAALTTLGASLLGSGAEVLIGDLSRRLTVDVLSELARAAGIASAETILPWSAPDSYLLVGVTWSELSNVLVEVLHSAQRDLDVSRRERQEDRSVIREVAACLDPSAPVSIARLRGALLVVQRVAIGDSAASIDPAERHRLSALFNEVQRTHGGVLERVIRIERALRDFDLLDRVAADDAGGEDEQAAKRKLAADEPARLRVIGVDQRADELENDRLVDLIFQLLMRRVRAGSAHADVLIVLGADRIRREAIESLIDQADQGHTAVVLMFEHLRQDAIELIGAGGAAAAFLTLGNHREAREASEFIGSQYKWVESTHTASASRSLTRTPAITQARTKSASLGLPLRASLGLEKTKSRSYSEAFGQSVEYSIGEERVREALIEPEVLMALPVTGMIRVEVLSGGRRMVTNLDCHPDITASQRVAPAPR